MGARRTWPWLIVIAAVAGAAVLFAPRPHPDREIGPAVPTGGRAPGDPTLPLGTEPGRPTRDEGPVPAGAPKAVPEVDALSRALAAGDAEAAQAAARDLRRRLRTEFEAFPVVKSLLLDPSTAPDLRMALAFVLGTLPNDAGDAALLEALRRFAADPAFVRCAVLALGAQREPEDQDDVFDLGDRPYGAKGPGGLGITVRRLVPAGEVEAAIASHLRRPESTVRQATAIALSHSLDRATVRTAFVGSLSSEATDAVAAALGDPLAKWAGSDGGERSERETVVVGLLARATEPTFDEYRFRLEASFERLPLSDRALADLAALVAAHRPFGTRAFALTALSKNAMRGGDRAVAVARAALDSALSDPDSAPVRDLSARLLGTLPYDARTSARLAAAVKGDPAWNVRFTALESLAKTAPRDEWLPVARAATSDPDSRVSSRAASLLGR